MDRNKPVFYFLARMKRLMLLPFAKLKYGNKQIWIVCERGTDARDNGYHMFRYLRTQHPEIEAWYIITQDSPDLKKISDLGNIAFRGSVNHWMLSICATKALTAFVPRFVPSGNSKFSQYIIKKNKLKVIFLQHGVIGVDLPIYYQEQAGFDLFFCGAKPEYEYVSSHYHYTHGEVRYTGLARFDALHDCAVKRQILIMPTYRKWLYEQTEQEAAQSEYVERWNHLLRHPRLTEITEKYNIQVVFYPHQLMQKFIGLFSSPNSHVIIGDCRHYDVQPLLRESSLLITDNSSVHFDFAYMKKPVLYYQFDEERFYKNHNGRSYYDYDRMGFGEKVPDEEKLLSLIAEYVSNDFRLKPAYEQRVETFFPLRDTCNCERIYQEILSTFGQE